MFFLIFLITLTSLYKEHSDNYSKIQKKHIKHWVHSILELQGIYIKAYINIKQIVNNPSIRYAMRFKLEKRRHERNSAEEVI